MQTVNKVWGHEATIVNNELYCAKFLVIRKGYQTSIHYHKVKDETFYVMEGLVEVMIGNQVDPDLSIVDSILLTPGNIFRVKPGTQHRIKAVEEDIKILEISTHHEDSDSIRLGSGGKIDE